MIYSGQQQHYVNWLNVTRSDKIIWLYGLKGRAVVLFLNLAIEELLL